MVKYKLIGAKNFIKEYKKLSSKLQDEVDKILTKPENGEKLGSKYKDHALNET